MSWEREGSMLHLDEYFVFSFCMEPAQNEDRGRERGIKKKGTRWGNWGREWASAILPLAEDSDKTVNIMVKELLSGSFVSYPSKVTNHS